jgi:hypothetical protein
MRNERMNILRRSVRAAEAAARKDVAAQTTVNRRIEVTVERETVTMLVRGQPAHNEQEAVLEKDQTEATRLELPPPAPTSEDEEKQRQNAKERR